MSLDVYLEYPDRLVTNNSTGIFVRENGKTVELTREQWDEKFPDHEPVVAERQISGQVYWANITHNLGKMADKAGIYKYLWRPDEIGVTTAEQLIMPLTDGLNKLELKADHYSQFNPENGWGDYDGLVQFVRDYLEACKKHPSAIVTVSR